MNRLGLVLFGMILAGSAEAGDYECMPEDLRSQRALGILAHVSHFFPTKPIEIARCLVAGGSRYWTAKWAVYEENHSWSKTGSAHCWSDDRQEIPDPRGGPVSLDTYPRLLSGLAADKGFPRSERGPSQAKRLIDG